jgi:hypothetical protein
MLAAIMTFVLAAVYAIIAGLTASPAAFAANIASAAIAASATFNIFNETTVHSAANVWASLQLLPQSDMHEVLQ